MNKGSRYLIIFMVFLYGCGQSNCFECINEAGAEYSFCEDSGINYTDQNGNILEFKDIKPYWESVGYTCE